MKKQTTVGYDSMNSAQRDALTLIVSGLLKRAEASEWVTCDSGERAALSALGIGCDSFNSYIRATAKQGGRFNINGPLLVSLLRNLDSIKVALRSTDAARSLYVTTGAGGDVHGGSCNVYRVDGIVDDTLTIVEHLGEGDNNGKVIVEGMLRNSRLVSEVEAMKLAEKRDFVTLKVTNEHGEFTATGALIGSIESKRQSLLVHDGEELRIVCAHLGKRGEKEKCNAAVIVGRPNDEEATKLSAKLFGGVVDSRMKSDKVNANRKAKRAARLAHATATATAVRSAVIG